MWNVTLFIIKSNLLDVNIVPRPFYNLFFKKNIVFCLLYCIHICAWKTMNTDYGTI